MGGLRQHSDPRKTVLQAPMWTRRASCSWRKLRGFPGQGTKVWCLPYGREPTGVTTFSPDLWESLLSLVRPVTLTRAQRAWCKAFPGHCQQSTSGTRSHGLRKDVNKHAGRPARLPRLFQAPQQPFHPTKGSKRTSVPQPPRQWEACCSGRRCRTADGAGAPRVQHHGLQQRPG